MSRSRAYIAWQESPAHLAGSLERWWNRVEGRLAGELQRAGAATVAFARLRHPWQNQTGAAEAGLTYSVRREGDRFIVEIGHTVYYGIYLEKRWAGRWGVIPAALTHGSPLVMQAAMQALRG